MLLAAEKEEKNCQDTNDTPKEMIQSDTTEQTNEQTNNRSALPFWLP